MSLPDDLVPVGQNQANGLPDDVIALPKANTSGMPADVVPVNQPAPQAAPTPTPQTDEGNFKQTPTSAPSDKYLLDTGQEDYMNMQRADKGLPPMPEISQAPAPSVWDKLKEWFNQPNQEQDQAKLDNVQAIAKANNLDPAFVLANYDALSKNSKMTGLTPDIGATKGPGDTLSDYAKLMTVASAPLGLEAAVTAPAGVAAALMAPQAVKAVGNAGNAAADFVTGSKPGTAASMGDDDSETVKQLKKVGDVALDTAVSMGAYGIAQKGVAALTGSISDNIVDNIAKTIFDNSQPNMDAIKQAYAQKYPSAEPTDANIQAEIKSKVMEAGGSKATVPQLLAALMKQKMAPNLPDVPAELPSPQTPISPAEAPNPNAPAPGPLNSDIVEPTPQTPQNTAPAETTATPSAVLPQDKGSADISASLTGQDIPSILKGLPYDALKQAHDQETASIIADKDLTKPEVEAVVQHWQSLSPQQETESTDTGSDTNATGDNPGPANDGSSNVPGPNLNSEKGSAYVPLDLAAKPIADGLDYVNRSMNMNPVANDIGYNLENLRTQKVADELGSKQLLTNANISPKDSEAIYHHVENPQEPLTPAQQQAYEKYIKPISDARNQLFAKIRNNGIPVDNEGYTPRYPVGKGNVLDRLQSGAKGVGQNSLLNKSTGQFKHRTMKALTDEKGNRLVASVKGGEVTGFKNNVKQDLGKLNFKSYEDIMNKELAPLQSEAKRLEKEQDILTATKGRYLAAESRIDGIHNQLSQIYDKINEVYSKHSYVNGEFRDLNGRVFQDKNGKTWNIGEATTKEIEAHTNVKYHKNILLNELLSYNKLRTIDRATTFLENLKGRPDFNNIGVKLSAGGNVPEKWRPINMPQFRGYAFEPRVADTLDKFYGELKSSDNADGILAKINDFMTTSIFFNPLIHIPNIANHWAVNRGLGKYFVPKDYVILAKTSARAIDAVIHQNDDYLQMLDAGANLLYHNTAGPGWGNFAIGGSKNLSDLMLEKMGEELKGNEQLAADVAKALGYANPLNLIKAVYEFSGKATWMTNDVATMQAVYEEMANGHSMPDAIKNIGKHIPDYRLPARVLDSKALADLMGNRSITMFSRYRYGALKSYGEMIKSLIGKTPLKEKAQSLDHLLMLGLITLVLYTQLDKLAKMLTGNKNAMVRRAGASTVPYNTERLLKGKIDFADYLFSILTPSPLLKFGAEEVLNRDVRTGREIRRPGNEGEDVLKHAAATVSPLQYYQRLEAGDMTPAKMGQQMVGISTPKNASYTNAEQYAANINKSKGFGGAMTDEQIDHYHAKQDLADDYDKTGSEANLNKAVDKGVITQTEADSIIDKKSSTVLDVQTKHMSYADIANILEHGKPTAQEKAELIDTFTDKIDRKINLLPEGSAGQTALEKYKQVHIDKFK